jgi:hypothetical protein
VQGLSKGPHPLRRWGFGTIWPCVHRPSAARRGGSAFEATGWGSPTAQGHPHGVIGCQRSGRRAWSVRVQARCVRGLGDSQLCNSHYVSQFATLVIVAGAEVSIVNSRKGKPLWVIAPMSPLAQRLGGQGTRAVCFQPRRGAWLGLTVHST